MGKGWREKGRGNEGKCIMRAKGREARGVG